MKTTSKTVTFDTMPSDSQASDKTADKAGQNDPEARKASLEMLNKRYKENMKENMTGRRPKRIIKRPKRYNVVRAFMFLKHKTRWYL
jgi:hypothetical protein